MVGRNRKVKIFHIITGLKKGGAETSLLNLLSVQDQRQYEASVFSLDSEGPLAERIRSLDVPVYCLNMQPGVPDLRAFFRLVQLIRGGKPDLIQTWMYHANLIGGLAARLAGFPHVIWILQHSPASLKEFKPGTRFVVWMNGRLSHFVPKKIICVAGTAIERHIRLGFDGSRMQVIHNGFDLKSFKPDADARRSVFKELGLQKDTFLIGLCARFHSDKDHLNFVRAAEIFQREWPGKARFVLWGKDVDGRNKVMKSWLADAGLEGCVYLLGERDDSARLMAALNLATLSSASEASPLVIGEAMACGVPCAVTDVGDSAIIVGNTGRVVPPHDPPALAGAWAELLLLPAAKLAALGRSACKRIRSHFRLEKMAASYAELYRDIIAGQHR